MSVSELIVCVKMVSTYRQHFQGERAASITMMDFIRQPRSPFNEQIVFSKLQ